MNIFQSDLTGISAKTESVLHRYEGVKHLSAGDLLRDAVKNGNTELEAIMKEGKLVPMDVTIALLKDAMIASGAKTFLIDGFPRAWDQVRLLLHNPTAQRRRQCVVFLDLELNGMFVGDVQPEFILLCTNKAMASLARGTR